MGRRKFIGACRQVQIEYACHVCVHRRAYISVHREQDTLRVYIEEKLCVESMFLVRMESTPRAALMGTVSRETGFLRGR
jgi:hypothetical protein